MRLNLPQRGQGHRFDNIQNTDLDQRLTYQQLLNLTHDLSKQNFILKNQTKRMGQQLSLLHSQFDMKPIDDNAELYQAIGAHPILHQYQATLVPLFDAYQYKIQEFEHQFQTVHEEFFSLQKKFQEVCKENQDLKMKLTDKTKQLLEVYRNGGNQKMHSDFGQIILDQINQKQKLLVQQNARLERDYQKYKAQSQKYSSEADLSEKKLDECKSKIRELEIKVKTLQAETKSLKQSSFQLQIKVNQIEAEKRRLEQAHQRAQSQNSQLNKQKQMYKNRLDELKARIQRDTNIPLQNDQSKRIEQLQTQINFLKAELEPNDSHKRLSKLQKDYDSILKQRQRLNQALENSKIREDQLNLTIEDLKSQNSKLTTEKSVLEKNEGRVNKSIQTLTEKLKNDIIKVKKDAQDGIQRVEFEFKHKIQMKDKRISQLEQGIEKLKLEKDCLQKQASLYQNDKPRIPSKDSERALNKAKQKLAVTQQLLTQHLQLYQNDISFSNKQLQKKKEELKQRTQQLRKLKNQYDEMKKQYDEIVIQKTKLVQEFRKVRDQYDKHLKEKEKLFDQKIRQIREVIQESERQRKVQRERVQQATRQYKRVLEDIQNSYQARIKDLEHQVTRVQVIRQQITPGR